MRFFKNYVNKENISKVIIIRSRIMRDSYKIYIYKSAK